MTTEIRPFRPEDEPELRRVMAASFEVDAFPGFTAGELEVETVSILANPEDVALAVDDGIVCARAARVSCA